MVDCRLKRNKKLASCKRKPLGNKNQCNKTISDSISHLNGYVLILEKEKNIPAIGVRNNIKKLKKLKKDKC